MVRKLQVAVSGLGRMGARHAINYLERTPRAELVAVCDPDPKAIAWAKSRLEPSGVTLYTSFEEMLAHPGVEAVIVSGITTEHAPQSIKAIKAGKHVLCEKPLSTDVDISQGVLDVAKQYPDLKVMTGFSRRFDQSYRNAWQKAEAGDIGRPVVFRSQTCDKYRDDDYFIGYSKTSGSIFVDASVHDIDLALWFFGQNSVVKSVSAVGTCARYQGLKQYGDVDNGVGIVEFWGGKIAYFYACRMMAVGQHDMTEVIGTHGKLTINANPTHDLVEHHEASGIRREIGQTYWDRFEPAFVRESNEFTESCLDGVALPFRLAGAVQALKIGSYLQESLRTGKKLNFDAIGEPIVEKSGETAKL
jgi:myo-inositol 2-dehydrogenase/D-chiro-inositol 1-dehydrogenase